MSDDAVDAAGSSDGEDTADGRGDHTGDGADGDGETSEGRERVEDTTAGDRRFAVALRGVGVDDETRCLHYHSPRDVVAIRFPCCDTYFPCHACHDDCTDHDAERWSADRFDVPAVLCGACRETLTVAEYLGADDACPRCEASFNPGCADHADRYFAVE